MQDGVSVIRRLFQYSAWASENLLAAAAPLDEAQLRREFAIGQGSVWKSLAHMFAAEYVWLAALQGNEQAVAPGDLPGQMPGNQAGPDAAKSLVELRERWQTLARRWKDYLVALKPESLDDMVYRYPSAAKGRFGSRRVDVLLHVCTHAQYTAAQTVNMFRQLGVEKLPVAMLMGMVREEMAGGK